MQTMAPKQRYLLVMKARHPESKIWYYFGSSISCAQFQLFSDALAHIIETKLGLRIVNYLDDFLFINTGKEECDYMVRHFLQLCDKLGCPVSPEKTEWSTKCIVFLGILLDGVNKCLSIPQEKKTKALNKINMVIEKKKVKIRDIQKLTGLLNFLQKAVVPGRSFTRRMYDKLKIRNAKGEMFKQFYHMSVDKGFKQDCKVLEIFLKKWQCEPLSSFRRFF